jgi:glycosyltransferase involved in cell wall biosynthesis
VKIVHIIDCLRSGGKERQLVEALKFLTKQESLECELVIMSNEIHYSYIEDLHIETYQILRKSKKDLSVFFRLYKLLKAIKPDIIHCWNSMCSVYALPACKMLGIKFVNNFLQDAPQNLSIKDQDWIRAKLTFPFSDIIAANSYAGLKAYKVPTKKSFCLHNGFDFSRLDNLDSQESIRERFSIQTKHVVGMVASFSDKKDYSTYIRAAKLVTDYRDDVTFVAVGAGEFFEDIKHEIYKNKNQDKVKLLGKQKRVLNIVNCFDIGVLATNIRVHGEGIPNVVMEYMALKKPVIATDCGGNRELVEDNKSGFLVQAENPEKVAEKILFLINNRDKALEIGQNGYNKLKEEFSLEAMGYSFLKLYKELFE